MTKREKITEIMRTLIVEGLADPIRIIFDTDYCAESVATYIEAANITRSALKMPLIDLNDYPDEQFVVFYSSLVPPPDFII